MQTRRLFVAGATGAVARLFCSWPRGKRSTCSPTLDRRALGSSGRPVAVLELSRTPSWSTGYGPAPPWCSSLNDARGSPRRHVREQ